LNLWMTGFSKLHANRDGHGSDMTRLAQRQIKLIARNTPMSPSSTQSAITALSL
jgi:hypothetical protein